MHGYYVLSMIGENLKLQNRISVHAIIVNGLTDGIGYCPARALRVNAPALCFCRVRMEISLYTR